MSSETLMPSTVFVQRAEEQHRRALELFKEGQYPESARILGEVLKATETSEIWNDWAMAQLMCHQTGLGEQGFRRALSMDPANHSAIGNLGYLLASTGRAGEALPLLERAAAKSLGRERETWLCLIQTCTRTIPRNGVAGRPPASREEEGQANPSGSEPTLNRREFVEEAANPQWASKLEASSGQLNCGKAGVYFQGHIYGARGYAEEAWVEALGLSESGIAVRVVPIDQTKDSKKLLPDESRHKLEVLQQQRVDLNQSVFLQYAQAGAWDMETCGRWCVVRTMFETDRLPDGATERCNMMDEIWVPGRFNLETYARAGVRERKLRLVPPGVDTRLFCPGAARLQIPRTRGFNFLSVFDWQQRKGYDVLLLAYLREFNPDDDVALILKTSQASNSFIDVQAEITWFVERKAGLRLEKAPPVILINGFIPQREMPRLYAAADCFVLPTRGEGYGRPFLEALSCQIPVIATGWGGQMDFLSQENSYLIDYRVAPVPDDVDLEVFAGHRWAEPEVSHLQELMRHVYSHRQEARKRSEQGRTEMVRRYDWNVVIPRWVAEFHRLLG